MVYEGVFGYSVVHNNTPPQPRKITEQHVNKYVDIFHVLITALQVYRRGLKTVVAVDNVTLGIPKGEVMLHIKRQYNIIYQFDNLSSWM